MHRRAFLATLCVTSLGGCLGNSGASTPDDPSGGSPEASPPDGGTPTQLEAEDVLSVERRGTVTDETGGGDRRFVEVRVENTWDRSIGKVTVVADWLGSDGAVVATTDRWVYAFEPGAVWDAAVPSDPASSSSDVEVAVQPASRTIDPGPLSTEDHGMTARDGTAVVTGTVTNEGEEDVFPTIFGKFFGEERTIVGGATAPINNVAAEDSAVFELSFPYERFRRTAPVDYELVLDVPDGSGADCLC